jgi:hypothetical protein
MLTTYVTTVVFLVAVLLMWLGVQRLWWRAFPNASDPDALAGRLGCHGCGCTDSCRREHTDSRVTAKENHS